MTKQEERQALEKKAKELIDLLHTIGGTEKGTIRFASRDLAIANTHIEDAVMRTQRHIMNQL
jgi:hypothetical protein